LPITGANLLAFTLAGAAFLIAGVVTLRVVYFLKRRKSAGSAALAPGDSGR
jgi:hypothetical protein